MFRSALTTLCRLRGSLPHIQQWVDVGRQQVHLARCMQFLEKDNRAKKAMTKLRTKEKEVAVGQVTEEVQDINFDSMFPSLETHSMLIHNTRYDDLPIIHIKATYNNTIISATMSKGEAMAHDSGGTVGFRNVKKGTNIAAQAAAISLAGKVKKMGVNLARISLKGIGPGRLPALKALQTSGITVVSITDATPLPHNGLRPKKQRR